MVRPQGPLALPVALALLLTACQTGAPAASGPIAPTPEPTVAIEKGGRVVVGGGEIRTMNPILSSDTASGLVALRIYDTLVIPDPHNGEPRPRMATFTQSSDGLVYTFTIRDTVNWSDGKPVVAADYLVATKLVGMSKVTTLKSAFQDVEGFRDFMDGKVTEISGVKIDPADPKKFEVRLTQVSCDAIFQIAGRVLPEHVFGKYAQPGQADTIDKAPENTAPPVASGPFKFKEWRPGDQVVLTRNETYWQGAPHVDEFVVKILGDANLTVAQLKTGEINYGTIQPTDLEDIERREHLRVHKTQQLGYTFIGWRSNSPTAPALADRRVRQALAYGLNMDDVIAAVLLGQGVKQIAHHVPGQWAYPDPKTLNDYKFDAAKAESLLRDAGYAKGASGFYEKDGKPISFTMRTNAGNKTRETLVQVASEQYRKIGVDARTSIEAFQGLVDKLTLGSAEIEAVIIGWALGPVVDPYRIWHSSQIPDPATKKTGLGFTFFKSAELDRAIEEGRNPADGDCSIATRKKHYETFNKILNEEQPYNFGFSPVTLRVTQRALQNYVPAAFDDLYNVHQWWFKGP